MATNWVEIIGFDQQNIAGNVGVLNASDVRINPAREETSLAILAALGGAAGLKSYFYGESLGVATGVPTTVVSYTVPVGKKFIMSIVQGAATNRADYEVQVGAVTIAKRYTQVTVLSTDFNFGAGFVVGVEVAAGVTIDVVITHNQPGTADMNATIFGELEDI